MTAFFISCHFEGGTASPDLSGTEKSLLGSRPLMFEISHAALAVRNDFQETNFHVLWSDIS